MHKSCRNKRFFHLTNAKEERGKSMKVCYTGGAVKDCGSYYSVATNAVELRIWFLTDDILRIRAGFDGD